MIKYVQKILDGFPEEIRYSSKTPAAEHLFCVRDEKEAKVLPEEQAQAFHYSVAQLLFLCMRARPDIQTTVVFLMMRVRKPDKDDWEKLKSVLKYLKVTKHMRLNLSIETLTTIQ